MLVVLAAAVPYLPTLDNYFAQDDFGVVGLLSQKPASYFPRWFVTTWMDDIWGFTPDEIRPFTALTYQVAAAFGPASPVPNHVVNIALHAANSLLVFGIARAAAGLGGGAALLAAVAFALLPMQAESVAWITGRVDSIPAMFYLGSFLLYVRWAHGTSPGNRPAYVWSLILFFCALFSKQNAITLAPALLLYDVIVRRRSLVPLVAAARPYVPFALLTAGYLGLRVPAVRRGGARGAADERAAHRRG